MINSSKDERKRPNINGDIAIYSFSTWIVGVTGIKLDTTRKIVGSVELLPVA